MGKLFLVPTPIGNLEDITYRAIRILDESDLILAEDTRKTGVLLKHFNINGNLRSYHQHNEHKLLNTIIEILESGKNVALVTDAGTPGISDPGFLIVRESIRNNIPVECLPGATAFIPALVVSGLPCDRFVFEGFLPHKKGRKSKLEMLKQMEYTMVFYESPYRLLKTLKQFEEVFGADRLISVSRELTKIYDETVRGNIKDVMAYFNEHTLKGEIVLVVAGNKP